MRNLWHLLKRLGCSRNCLTDVGYDLRQRERTGTFLLCSGVRWCSFMSCTSDSAVEFVQLC